MKKKLLKTLIRRQSKKNLLLIWKFCIRRFLHRRRKKLKFIMNFFIQIILRCSLCARLVSSKYDVDLMLRLKKYCNEVTQIPLKDFVSFSFSSNRSWLNFLSIDNLTFTHKASRSFANLVDSSIFIFKSNEFKPSAFLSFILITRISLRS